MGILTKNKISFALLFFILVFSSGAQAQTAGLSPLSGMASQGAPSAQNSSAPGMETPIGVAAAVKGTIEISGPGKPPRTAQSGIPIFMGDKISTDANGHLQILLRDQTVFTLGPNSSIVMDRFIYDPRSETGKVSAQVVKGVFRFVSGKIAKKNPQDMEVNLPSGNIGIRGTIVGGRCNGSQSLVILMGPGGKNNAGTRSGQITVSNVTGNKTSSVNITRPGYGTEIAGAGQPPSFPAFQPQAVIDSLITDLEPPKDDAKAIEEASGPGPSASSQAKQDTFGALSDLSVSKQSGEFSKEADTTTGTASQNASNSGSGPRDGIATLDDLRRIQSGTFVYEVTGPLGSFVQTKKAGNSVNLRGFISAKVLINFGTREIGGSNGTVTSVVQIDTDNNSSGGGGGPDLCQGRCTDTSSAGAGNINNQSDTIDAISFASGSGDAFFTDPSPGAGITGSITLNNQNGVVAQTATLQASFNDGAGNQGSSSIANIARQAV